MREKLQELRNWMSPDLCDILENIITRLEALEPEEITPEDIEDYRKYKEAGNQINKVLVDELCTLVLQNIHSTIGAVTIARTLKDQCRAYES